MRPVLLDVNLTEDFAAGFLLAARAPELDILGVTVTFGETDLATAAQNTAELMDLCGLSCPVALGADRPWRRTWELPPRPMPLGGAINGMQLDPAAKADLSPLPAAEFLYETLRAASQPVTLLCSGPLTNVAALLERHPDAKSRIGQLVWRGGTQRHAVNGVVRDLQTLLDPEAAAFVLEAGLPFVMCPVDMGHALQASQGEVDAGIGLTDPVLHQLNRLLKKRWCEANENQPIGQRTLGLPLQDVAAAVYLLDPEAFTAEPFHCEVDLKGRYTFGMCVVDICRRMGREDNILLLRDADHEWVISRLYQ